MKRIIATPNKDVVVFIIGLRINRLRSVQAVVTDGASDGTDATRVL
ncbi:hypothetical protein OVA29_10165 [Exiguobacterium sp. SL14]|nr:hypothetical protein [Exiguobacterium sp. SL14]MCY1690986.1 hypothetical protein [Exiguobacterium sp. SL14]